MREDVVLKREVWQERQKTLDKNKLIFVDESSINCGMTRLYGRALTKNRVNEYVPDVRFERTSIVSSIRLNGDTVPLIFKGTLNGELFGAYIKQCLAPTLSEGDIVIMDNCSSHKVKDILQPIFDMNATVLFLPPYSPDFNPIEMSWSKMKSILRKSKPRTYDELLSALQIALSCFSLDDIANWFSHDGYIINL
jgi:transposase